VEERIDLVAEQEKPQPKGIGLAIGVSIVLHILLLILFYRADRPVQPAAETIPIARYVELIQRNPQQPPQQIREAPGLLNRFTEAPGPTVERAPLDAPLSDANRKASIPHPTGDQPTTRPGERNAPYAPPMNPGPRGRVAPPAQAGSPTDEPRTQGPAEQAPNDDRLIYRESKPGQANGGVDWKSAIREVSRVASLGGGDGFDLGQVPGGQKGFAEQGPVSFETQWFEWGPYAQAMISKLRVNWYAVMPPILNTGMKGQVTIRFTIQRDGRITNIETLRESGVTPYDYAARKAIELSSPLKPLPANFPYPSERVTVIFLYNMEVPAGSN
jgi:TonB family protein